ncbi:MAG: SPFH domain-containing protein [Candidatus Korarchaeota archaeon]
MAPFFIKVVPQYVAVVKRFMGKYSKKVIIGGRIIRLPFQRLIMFDLRQKIIRCGFFGERGQKSEAYLNWIKKLFPDPNKIEPLLQRYAKIDTKIKYAKQLYESGFGRHSKWETGMHAREFGPLFTKDRIMLNMVVSAFYRIADPWKLLNTLGKSRRVISNEIVELALISHLSSAIRLAIANMTLIDVFERRELLTNLLMKEMVTTTEKWGIEFASIAVEEVFLEKEELQSALDDRRVKDIEGDKDIALASAMAEENKIRAETGYNNQLIQAKAEAERAILAAKEDLERTKIMVEEQKQKIEARKIAELAKIQAWKTQKKAELEKLAKIRDAITPKVMLYNTLGSVQSAAATLLENSKIAIIGTSGIGGISTFLTGESFLESLERIFKLSEKDESGTKRRSSREQA